MTLPITWSTTEPPFDAALRFTRFEEGGLSDDPNDHGGRTKWGVTQASYNAWRFARKLPQQVVDLMTADEMASIYKTDYWDAGTCQPMPAKLGIAHFDWCVNHGPNGAKRMLQGVLGVAVDGVIGQGTLAAIQAHNTAELVSFYLQARREWYHSTVDNDPTQERFLKGWENRVDHLISYLDVA